jgi:hypothetical protein
MGCEWWWEVRRGFSESLALTMCQLYCVEISGQTILLCLMRAFGAKRFGRSRYAGKLFARQINIYLFIFRYATKARKSCASRGGDLPGGG